MTVDVKCVGVNKTAIGFSTLNRFIHSFMGVNMTIYHITDWLGLVPIGVCFGFGITARIKLG